jgi:hypothetical protein
MLLAAGVLAAGTAGAAAAADQVWLALSIAASDRSQAGEAAALRDGRRLGPVVSAGRDRAYPLPGFVPADADDLARGLRIAPGRAHPPRLVLRRSPTGEFLLLDPDGAVLAVPAVREEPPIVAIELPLHLLRPLLPKAEGMDAEAVAAARGMGLVAPLRIASVDGGAGRMVRSHREGVRRRQTAALGVPVLRYTPAGRTGAGRAGARGDERAAGRPRRRPAGALAVLQRAAGCGGGVRRHRRPGADGGRHPQPSRRRRALAGDAQGRVSRLPPRRRLPRRGGARRARMEQRPLPDEAGVAIGRQAAPVPGS